jgi:hypothetical protein
MTWESAYQNPLGYERNEENTPAQEEFETKARERYEYCVKMAQIFKGKAGKDILKIWRENTIEAATWMPSISMQHGREAACDHAFAREGQNAFVRDIENCIEIANKCKTLEDFYSMINQVGTANNI